MKQGLIFAAIMAFFCAMFLWAGYRMGLRERANCGIQYHTEGGFCSSDGKLWWQARKDGMCYAADEPSR